MDIKEYILVSVSRLCSRKDGTSLNKNFLISKMKLFGDTQESLAKALGISLTRLNEKINETDGAEFWQHEIVAIKIRYNLTPDEVDQIFFAQKVS